MFDQVAIRNRARRRYAIVAAFVILLAGLFAVALIQARLVANQQRLDQLRAAIAESESEHTRLERLVEEASAPSAIIDQAMEMGLVRAADPIYLAATEPAVAVPVPVALGSSTSLRNGNAVVAAGEVEATDSATAELVAAGVSAALEVVGSSNSDEPASQLSASSVSTGEAVRSVASVAGTTAVATGMSSAAPAATGASTNDPVTSVGAENETALSSIEIESVSAGVDQTAAGPAWAGAVVVAGTSE